MGILGALGYFRSTNTKEKLIRLVTFLSDFGLQDGYVASVKGVINICSPQTPIVDISHLIPSQNVRHAAFVLSTVVPYFPKQAVHLAVVDPGVGTNRRLLAVKTPHCFFVAPDNGILSLALKPYISQTQLDGTVVLDKKVIAVSINNRKHIVNNPSPTFDGRDILAPAVAALCTNMNICELGDRVFEIKGLNISNPSWQDNELHGEVLHIDHFGNIITNICKADLPTGEDFSIYIGNHEIIGLKRTYSDKQGLLALIQSDGYLEIALNGGSAQQEVGAKITQEVRIKLSKEAVT